MTPAEELRNYYAVDLASDRRPERMLFKDGVVKLDPVLLPKLNASGQYRTSGRCGEALWTLYTYAAGSGRGVQWSVTLNYLKGRGRRHYTDFAETRQEANAAGLGVIEFMAAHPSKRGRGRWIPRKVIGRSRRRRAVLKAMQAAKPVRWEYLKPRYEMAAGDVPSRESVEAAMTEAGEVSAAALSAAVRERLGI